MKIVFHALFLASFLAFLCFFFAEYLFSGFVMPFFSVYLIGFLVLVFGAISLNDSSENRVITIAIKACLSVLLLTLFLREGELFGNLRIVLAIIAGLIPWLFTKHQTYD